MNSILRGKLSSLRAELTLPIQARRARAQDRGPLPELDPDIDQVIRECIEWICRAQDNSPNADGGVARHYSLINGWGNSYPETSGYIVPTLLEFSDEYSRDEIRVRAQRILDWLVSIQFPDGGFQGGMIGEQPRVPVTFNTGQILIGLAAGAKQWEKYIEPMKIAASWLVKTQDLDGCWRSHPTPFAAPGEKAYETHVSWGLLEAAKVAPGNGYEKAAIANINWAIKHQTANGWIRNCCLHDPMAPLTHTLGYFLRGIIEGYLYFKDPKLLKAANLTAEGLLSAIDEQGHMPGRLYSNWQPAVNWACLTGMAQIAHCWILLSHTTGRKEYSEAGFRANKYVRRTINVHGSDNIRGGVKGSFPINGNYGKYQYLNWAAKFCVDSLMIERRYGKSK